MSTMNSKLANCLHVSYGLCSTENGIRTIKSLLRPFPGIQGSAPMASMPSPKTSPKVQLRPGRRRQRRAHDATLALSHEKHEIMVPEHGDIGDLVQWYIPCPFYPTCPVIFSTFYAWNQHGSTTYPGNSSISPAKQLIRARLSRTPCCHQSKPTSPPESTNNLMAATAGPHTHHPCGQAPYSHSGGPNPQHKTHPSHIQHTQHLWTSRALNMISNTVDALFYQKITLTFHHVFILLKPQLELLLLNAQICTKICLPRNLLCLKLHSIDRVILLKAKPHSIGLEGKKTGT